MHLQEVYGKALLLRQERVFWPVSVPIDCHSNSARFLAFAFKSHSSGPQLRQLLNFASGRPKGPLYTVPASRRCRAKVIARILFFFTVIQISDWNGIRPVDEGGFEAGCPKMATL